MANQPSAESRQKGAFRTMIMGIVALVAVLLWIVFFVAFYVFGPASNGLLETQGFLLVFIGTLPVVIIWLITEIFRVNHTLSDKIGELQRRIKFLQNEIEFHSLHAGKEIKYSEEAASEIPDQQPAARIFRTGPEPEATLFSPPMEEESYRDNALSDKDRETSILDEWQVDYPTLIRALNLPDNDEDKEGFEAFDLAAKNDLLAVMLHSSLEILYSMAGVGLYMDVLTPDLGPLNVWRDYAKGEAKGPDPTLGGAGSQMDIASAVKLLSADEDLLHKAQGFYQNVHDFLIEVIPVLSDEEVVDLAETRTLRLFLLLGQAFIGE